MPRTWWIRFGLGLALLMTVGCDGDGGGNGAGDTMGADTTVGADTAGADTTVGADTAEATCPTPLGDLPNTPCPTASEGLSCRSTMDWCGQSVMTMECGCRGGVWQCAAAGAPAPCHECCQTQHDSMWFCRFDGTCVEADGCLAEDCCVPGAAGTSYCKATFGDCSTCDAGETTGTCSPETCE